MDGRKRLRDPKGRFVAKPTPGPLSAQVVGDLTALQIPEEAPPANCLETRSEWRIHASWWQAPSSPRA
jgi:hypothetical protein